MSFYKDKLVCICGGDSWEPSGHGRINGVVTFAVLNCSLCDREVNIAIAKGELWDERMGPALITAYADEGSIGETLLIDLDKNTPREVIDPERPLPPLKEGEVRNLVLVIDDNDPIVGLLAPAKEDPE